ncbi:phosphotransferase family protein [Pseudomonas sp. BJa5]|uniref:phosphotransferase family protein n=1 Tax=Pseudomonas sp. BJa5 TaxID=2936270 RepID=UPI0025595ECC|nr:phosphotransferase family protein [Pseudomonas sp. BGr12]MDL2424125.1 phosphotransferase family protein [Pseudomonas sp. BGr12]
MSTLFIPPPGAQHADVPDAFPALASYLRQQLGADKVVIDQGQRLSGGAIQENWLLTGTVTRGGEQSTEQWVLRTDSASSVAVSMGRAQEFAVLAAVHQAGVKVPEPLWLCRDLAVLGRDFFLMRKLEGHSNGHRLTTDLTLEPLRSELCRALGENLGLIHRITPDHPDLGFLPPPASDPAQASIDQYRRFLDALPGSYPVIEWGLRWCELNKPLPMPARLLHRDYRTGNYMVDALGLTGVLDWEFTGWGDPREDIGWFTARCWRFARADREAGGMGELNDFLQGYKAVSGYQASPQDLRFWQLMAHLRWAVVALQQTQRHLSGQQRSLELALTGTLLAELEQDILLLSGAQP